MTGLVAKFKANYAEQEYDRAEQEYDRREDERLTMDTWHSDGLVSKAYVLYLRAALLSGAPALEVVQPIPADSTRDGDVIVLRNGKTVAARFRVRPDGVRLRRLDVKRVRNRARQPAAAAVDPTAST
jgi:hypothetical protein